MGKRLHAVLAAVAMAASPLVQAQDYSGLDFSDHSVVITTIEYITDPASGEAGGIEVLQRDTGNGQLSQDFVYGDPRNAFFWNSPAGVGYAVKSDNSSADEFLTDQEFWLQHSARIWQQSTCSNLELVSQPTTPGLPGLVKVFFETGVIDISLIEADLTQVGFLSAAEFVYFAANPNVLGVAFTLSWVDGEGNLTDIDNNKKSDVAFREIYYNDEFEWADDGREGTQTNGIRYFDFPTVAIHESGHGLSAAHFGTVAVKNGALFAKPRAIMNAIYGGTLRDLTGNDLSSHCANWAQWPNR